MPTPPRPRDEDHNLHSLVEGISIERDFDTSWLTREPPGYADVDANGQVIDPDKSESEADGDDDLPA